MTFQPFASGISRCGMRRSKPRLFCESLVSFHWRQHIKFLWHTMKIASGLLWLRGPPGRLQHALRVPCCGGVAKFLEERVSFDLFPSLAVYRCSLSKMEVRAWCEIMPVGTELQAVSSLIAYCAVSHKWKIRARCAVFLVGEEVQKLDTVVDIVESSKQHPKETVTCRYALRAD
jgi:hypothetical protein